ncbi:hypothetical protein [Streptomyces sp. YIM 98790]|uniref:hypothetical protein n=1 Tax=Streptomyces sp. YIM 98790 TaxID=2689077 RepID=UPI001FB688A2|nr:hypothetical protein [Streptomyces sp. YIM 98790]
MFRTLRAVVTTALALALGATLTVGLAHVATAEEDGTAARPAAAQTTAERTTTVRYGPYTIPAAEDHHSGGDAGGTHNQFAFNIEKPCSSCYITGFEPNLVYADGSHANVNTGPMLHHAVIFNSGDDDVVCRGPQRIFSTGNERVASSFPAGYGYRVGFTDRWSMVYDLMNHATEEKTVYLTFTFTHRSVLSGLEELTPIWMDAGGCLNSAWDAPEGVSEKSHDWRSTISGELVHMRGHVHHAGRWVRTENLGSGRLLCHVTAEEGGSPEFIDPMGHTEISDMPPCSGSLGTINRGDTLRITARYEINGHSHEGVMGIMTGWVDER